VVCRPRAPLCETCPVSGACAAFATGAPETYPRRAARAERPRRFGAAFVILRGDAVALERRPARGLLGGMAGLPTTAWREEPWSVAQARATAPFRAAWGEAGAIEHVFTHFSLRLLVLSTAERPASAEGWDWSPLDAARAALPSVFRKALEVAAPAERQLI
jgi:A/G-specific adenine glycosylase